MPSQSLQQYPTQHWVEQFEEEATSVEKTDSKGKYRS